MVAREMHSNDPLFRLAMDVERLNALTSQEHDTAEIPNPTCSPELSKAAPRLVSLDGRHVLVPGLGLGAIRHLMVPGLCVGLLILAQVHGNLRPDLRRSQLMRHVRA